MANELESLANAPHEGDRNGLEWTLKSAIHCMGREALMKKKEAEIEALLSDPKPEPPPLLAETGDSICLSPTPNVELAS